MSPQLLPEAQSCLSGHPLTWTLDLSQSNRWAVGVGGCRDKEMLAEVLLPDLRNKEAWRGEGAGMAFSKQRNWVT